jgi:hypothetical protein
MVQQSADTEEGRSVKELWHTADAQQVTDKQNKVFFR